MNVFPLWAVDVDVRPPAVTLTVALPAACDGETTVMSVSDASGFDVMVALAVPKATAVAQVKPLPWMSTVVPPPVDPDVAQPGGVRMYWMVGAAA